MVVWIENPFDNLPLEGYRAQRYWLMSKAFASCGHEVVYWTSDFSHSRKKKRCLQDDFFGYGFELRFIETLPYRSNISFRRLRSHKLYAQRWKMMCMDYVKEHRAPDVVIVSSPPLATGDVALFLKRKFSCKVVVDIMDAWPQTFERLLPGFLRFFGRFLFSNLYKQQKRLLLSSDLVTGVSKRYGQLAKYIGVRSYHLAYHGIELSEAIQQNFNNGNVRIVYAGSLGKTYDLKTVIEAVSGISKCELFVAGDGENVPKLKRLVDKLKCGNKVFFTGYLSEAALKELLRSCDIGVIPMPSDSFVGVPYKLADYSASSLAIASCLGGETEQLLSAYGAGVFYRFGDVNDCIRAITELSNDLYEKKRSSYCMAKECFDATVIYSDFVSKVQHLVS
jgi:glycosyltransferase involved in cell wall biosynthesis